jgi:hypothetical protein
MQLNGGLTMTEQAAAPTRHDLEAKIVKRCWEDEEFRKEFTADPAGAFVKYLRVPATSVPKIVVHEETTGSWHIVLPAKPPHIDELSEQDLERVAGGTTPAVVSVATGLITISTASGAVLASAVVSVDRGW